jgi:Family of unknown function (DUF5906)
LLRYIAHMFQYPEVKAGIAIIFNGGQGTGKDVFLEFIERLLGDENYTSTGNPEEVVFSRFNAACASKILIHIEEMSRNLFKKYSEKVKSKITKKQEKYEDKGEKFLTLASYERYIFTTNDSIATYLEDGERRMVIFTPSKENCGNTNYFDALISDMENPSVCRKFYDYLMSIDLTGWKIRVRQITETYKETLINSAPPVARLFNDICLRHNLDKITKSMEDMIDELKHYSQYDYKSSSLGRELMPYRYEGAILMRHNKSGQQYCIDIEKMKAYLKSKCWWYDPKDVRTIFEEISEDE